MTAAHSRPQRSSERLARDPSLALRALTIAGLLALTLTAFGGVVRNGWFGIDDYAYVRDNPHVNAGLTAAGLRWELTHAEIGNYSPVTMLSHMLDVQLFGMRTGAFHAVSLALHALNAVLLLLVLFGLTGAWWRSAAVAALFAVHPLRVESVAWIAERKDVLSTTFFLAAIALWRRWTLRPGALRYALVCLALVLGLLAKPMLVTLPLVLLLLDAWPLGRLELARDAVSRGHSLAERVREKWGLWIIVIAFSVLTLRTQGSAGALAIVPGLTLPLRLSNALRSVWIYVAQELWPHRLVAFVPHDLQPHAPAAALSAVALAIATGLVLRAKRRPWLATGWLWYLVTVLPVINLVQVGPHARADRFTYVPAIGLAWMLVWELGERVQRSRAARLAAAALLAATLVALSLATARQIARWRDTRTMYEWILANEPGEGTTMFRWLLGDIELHEGHPSRALADYEQVEKLAPTHARVHMDIANALVGLGRLDEALGEVQRAVEMAPDSVEYRRLLAEAMKARGRYGEALLQYEAIAARRPDDRNALLNAAWMRATLPDPGPRDGVAAVRMAEHALALDSRPPAALVATAAAAYAETGRWDDAVAAADRAVAIARAARSDGEAEEYARELAAYRARHPWRGPPH
jgi:tetratricopeptide (TPR) repeat protein